MVCIKDARNLVRIRASWSRVWLRVTAVAVARRSMKQQLNSRRAMSAAAAAAAAARSDSAARRRGAAQRGAAQRSAVRRRHAARTGASVSIVRQPLTVAADRGGHARRHPHPGSRPPPPSSALIIRSVSDRTFALPLPTSSVACMPRDGVLPC